MLNRQRPQRSGRPTIRRRPALPKKKPVIVYSEASCHSKTSCGTNGQDVYTHFIRIMSQTGALALASKLLGLVREQMLTSSFGLGGLADAFSVASIIPLLALSGVGGLNGALHCAMASTCKHLASINAPSTSLTACHEARENTRDTKDLMRFVRECYMRLGLILGLLALLLTVCAPVVVSALAPGLAQQHHTSAVCMLRMMSPVVLLSGFIGVSIGALVFMNRTLVPSALSMVGNLAFICVLWFCQPLQGTERLGLAVLASAVAQWLLSLFALERCWQRRSGGTQNTMGHDNAALFHRMFLVATPALLTTCVVHGASWMDLMAASYIPGAAAGISYAYILGMAPFGILSAGFLTPLLQLLPRVHHSEQVHVLLQRLPTLLRLIAPTAASVTVLAPHIVVLAFSGGAFQGSEVAAVAALLPYVQLSAGLGMLRDVLVRLHYVRGSGWLMLTIQLGLLPVNACINAVVLAIGAGPSGIVGTTALASGIGLLLAWMCLRCEEQDCKKAWRLLRDALVTAVAAAISAALAIWCMGGMPPVTDRSIALSICVKFGLWMVGFYGASMAVMLLPKRATWSMKPKVEW
eukprot:jgi/Ulvmu1/7338/UM035_0127.1